MSVFAAPLRRLRARGAWALLLPWRRTLDILLPGTSLFRRALSILPSRCGLHGTFLIALLVLLPHYGVTRLVTVTLLLQLMLLLHLSGIAVP